MKLDKSILNLTLTEFNKSIINNLGNEVWKKINKELPETKIDNYSAYVTTVLQGMTTGSYADFEAEQDDSEDASDPKKQENAD